MAKAFISYKHSADVDERLADYLEIYLTEQGHQVFIDRQITIGQTWPTIIEQELKSADFLILLLSAQSVASEMVIQEVKIAHNFKKIILPVRVAYEEDLPYDLGAYLNRVQYKLLSKDDDKFEIGNQLNIAMMKNQQFQGNPTPTQNSNIVALTADGSATQSNETLVAPLPTFDPQWLNKLDAPGGGIRLTSPFYIMREIDEQAKTEILKEGVTLRLKGSRQMGKTSLLARLRQYIRDHDSPVVYVDFTFLDSQEFESLETLLLSIANYVAKALKTTNSPAHHWQSPLGAMRKLTNFLSDEVLSSTEKPFVLIMDRVDRVFRCEYRDDFFGLIRSWHDNRAMDEAWEKFNIVLSYSKEAYLFIQNLHQSPFNVGTEVNVTDFDRVQVKSLNQRHGQPVRTEQELDAITELLGGHPFLTRKALYYLVQGLSTNELVQQACYDDGPFSDHLHSYLMDFYGQDELRVAMKDVILTQSCSEDTLFYRLRSSGLILGHNRHHAWPRCSLYGQYFKTHL